MWTKKEFKQEIIKMFQDLGITPPDNSTLNRWLQEEKGKIKPAEHDDRGKPLYSEEQLSIAKNLYNQNKVRKFDNKEEPMENFTQNNENPAQENAGSVIQVDENISVETPPFQLTLEERANRIRAIAAKSIIEIGFELIEAKKQVAHGGWSEWLRQEFDWDIRTAQNCMSCAERFGKTKTFSHLGKSKLIKLLSLREGDEQAFIDAQAEAGNPIENQSARQVQENVKQWNQKAEKNNSTDESNHTEISPPEAHDGDFEEEPSTSPTESNQDATSPPEPAESDFEPEPETNGENVSETKKPPIAKNGNGKNNEYYTPQKYVDAARDVLGSIDLDPASCDLANQTVKAANYFTAETDGLNQNWQGNIYLNPPFATGLIEKFVDKLLVELESGNVISAIVLVDNATETKWFCNLAARADSICFTNHRINFIQSNGQIEKGSPTRGQAFLLFNGDRDKFVDVFSQFGWCCLPAKKEVC